MILGIILLLLTGLCWVGIALVVSMAAKRGLNLDFIQFASSCVIAITAVAVMLFQPPLDGSWGERLKVILPVLMAGGFNFLMLKWMKVGMNSGNSGAVWAITQSALLCPFLMGMLFFGVKLTVWRLVGMAAILAGIFLFSRTKPNRSGTVHGWLLPTLGAFAASGAAQCLANLPSYWTTTHMSSACRASLVQVGTIGAFLLLPSFRAEKFRFRGTLSSVIILSAVQILSLFFFFYHGLNLVAAAERGSIGYPIAQGSSIAFFLIYSCLIGHEKCQRLTCAALVSLLFGIFTISIS